MSRKKLKPLEKIETVEYAVRSVKDYIIGGNLKPGTDLPTESEMARQIGVSKFSMREALRVLQAQGLVDIAQGRRTRVADLSSMPAAAILSMTLQRSKSPLFHLTEARRSLEGSIARLAAQRALPSHMEAMQETVDAMEKQKNNLEFCVEKDIEFHNILLAATENRVFEMMFIPLTELLRESRKETLRVGGVDRALNAHKLILSAVMKKDPEKAEACMNFHLDNAEEDLRKSEELGRRRKDRTGR